MNSELKMRIEDIKNEMQSEILPYLKTIGVDGFEALQLAVRYGWERSKDYEWESNERSFGIIKAIVTQLNTPLNKFQRKWGKLCTN